MSENIPMRSLSPPFRSVITDAEARLHAFQNAATMTLKDVFQATEDISRERDELRASYDALLQERQSLEAELEKTKHQLKELKAGFDKTGEVHLLIKRKSEAVDKYRAEAQRWKARFDEADAERHRLLAHNDELVTQRFRKMSDLTLAEGLTTPAVRYLPPSQSRLFLSSSSTSVSARETSAQREITLPPIRDVVKRAQPSKDPSSSSERTSSLASTTQNASPIRSDSSVTAVASPISMKETRTQKRKLPPIIIPARHSNPEKPVERDNNDSDSDMSSPLTPLSSLQSDMESEREDGYDIRSPTMRQETPGPGGGADTSQRASPPHPFLGTTQKKRKASTPPIPIEKTDPKRMKPVDAETAQPAITQDVAPELLQEWRNRVNDFINDQPHSSFTEKLDPQEPRLHELLQDACIFRKYAKDDYRGLHDHLSHIKSMRSRLANLSLSGADLEIGQDLSKKLEVREDELRRSGAPIFEACLRSVEDQARKMTKEIAQHEEAMKMNTVELQTQPQANHHTYLSARKEKLLSEVAEIQKLGKLFEESADGSVEQQ